ncbi:syndecan-2-like [Clupea harengus]|uniref:Syndecan n=1 Tax=Clupea harengus TaxID=7950 RepID=A0A8M1K9C9_CLUHA|nr:syndecan-2-like [Clupea harengus]
MKHIWILLTFSALVWFSGEKVRAQSPSPADDLYLEDQASGDFPVDDDDFNSGSGSGDGDDEDEVITRRISYSTPEPEVTPEAPEATSPSTDTDTGTSEDTYTETAEVDTTEDRDLGTEAPVEVTEDSLQEVESSRAPNGRSVKQNEDLHDVRSENLFQRTEVLAAVIAGGVIGFLFALFLILLLVYRMRKKDEGSYDLGERKPPVSAYQKAPTKEFYA